MSTTTCIGRVGALAVALGLGFAVATTPAVGYAEPTDSTICPSSDSSEPHSTALILGGTTIPTPNDADVKLTKNQFVAPTHPGQNIEYCAVTTPEELWPLTGLGRLVGLTLGPPSIFGPGGSAWPDEPWGKLSGLFDLTLDQSVQAGVGDLEQAMAARDNDHLVISGYSQSSIVATVEKRKLAEQYPAGTAAPDIDFVLGGTLNLPNGGLFARFPGLYLPIIDWSFNGPAPTDTQFDTVVINQQYDFFADFPLYPLNLIADLNAVLGFIYVHSYPFDVSLPADPTKSPAYQGAHGDTSYYFFETPDLPLFGPLRTLGVPESLIDVVEPFFRVLVELGYDRSIAPWEPTPARLIPPLSPVTVVADLVSATGEGLNNALAITGSPAPLSIPASPSETANAGVSDQPALRAQVADTGEAPQEKVTVQAASQAKATETGQAKLQEKASDTDGTTSTTVSTSKPAKQADTPATRRPVARGPFGQRIRGVLRHDDADAPTARVSAVGDGSAPVGPSSGASPSAGSGRSLGEGSSSDGSSGGGSVGEGADGS